MVPFNYEPVIESIKKTGRIIISGDASARDVANLIETITTEGVSVVFTDVGTPQSVARTVADDAGAEIVEMSVAQLPEDGSYQTFMLEFAQTIADAFAQ